MKASYFRPRFLFLGAEILSLAAGLALCRYPLASPFALRSGHLIFGWLASWFRLAYPAILLLLAAVAFFLSRACRRALRSVAAAGAAPAPATPLFPAYLLDRAVDVLRPWLWFPAILFLGYSAEWVGPVPATSIVALLVCLLGALSFETIYTSPAPPSRIPPTAAPSRAFPWLAVSMVAYFIFILLVTPSIMGISGDEKHYQIQRKSLVTEHNLNLNTELADILVETKTRADDPIAVGIIARRSHLKQNADGNYYSFHSFGFPLLAVPFSFLGKWGDAALLALISCLGLLGCRAAILAVGAPRRAANLTIILLALSTFWAFNSGLFLPESLGLALAAWAFWAACDQERHPWASAIVAAVACAYLPLAHIRFLPLAGILALAYGLEGLVWTRSERWPQKLLRLAIFSAICFAAWGILAFFQSKMFSQTASGTSGSSYDFSNILLSYPQAMWGMWADRRGLAAFFPLLYWLAPATLLCCVLGSAPLRRRAIYAATATATVLLTCCSTRASLAGLCFQGRYLMQTVPLLLPFGAVLLARTARPGRLLAFLLAAPPVLMLLFVTPQFDIVKGNIIRLPAAIRGTPAFGFLWEPLASLLNATTATELNASTAYAVALLLACAAAALPKPRLQATGIALCLAVAIPAGAKAHSLAPPPLPSFTRLFSTLFFRHYTLDTPSPDGLKPDIFDYIAEPQPIGWYLTGRPDASLPHLQRAILSNIAPNDWTPANRRWFSAYRGKLIRNDYNGQLLIRIRGDVLRGTALVAAKQGPDLLVEPTPIPAGPFDVSYIIRTRRHRGWIEPIFTLQDNEGLLYIRDMNIIPYQPPFAELFTDNGETTLLPSLPR